MYFYITCCVALTLYNLPAMESKHPPKLLLISMDGFRWDYTTLFKNETKHFQFLIKKGVQGKLMNVFPTVTYPNHYTLLTGLYPESHGIVHNRFYDSSTGVKSYFWYDNIRDNFDPVWFDVGAEPIYVTNKKAGSDRNCGSVLWPCGLGKVKGIAPDWIIPNADPFNQTDFHKRVDYIIEWFTDKTKPINLGLLYFNEPDEIAHKSGAGSEEVRIMIKKLDTVLEYLIQKLKDAKLFDDMNIILTADHGFTNVTQKIALSDLGLEVSKDYHTGSHFENHVAVQLYPTNLTSLLEKLSGDEGKNISVYVKDKSEYLKNTLHYNNNVRIAPVVLTGNKEGVLIFKDQHQIDNFTTIGIHGQDPHKFDSMHPFFIAMGPAFKEGYTAPKAFNSVDMYPLMCHILGLTPASNNGSLEEVMEMLTKGEENNGFTLTGISFLILIGFSITVAGLYSICACHNARKKTSLLRGTQRPSGLHTHHLLDSDSGGDDEF